jgi:hypothetical protein
MGKPLLLIASGANWRWIAVKAETRSCRGAETSHFYAGAEQEEEPRPRSLSFPIDAGTLASKLLRQPVEFPRVRPAL